MSRHLDASQNVCDVPYIDAHMSGKEVVWIDMMRVPPEQRRRGIGRNHYAEWEAELPKSVKLVRLMAADTGSGKSNGFWEAMGFDYVYTGGAEDMDYETSQQMWKGVNGHKTPRAIRSEA